MPSWRIEGTAGVQFAAAKPASRRRRRLAPSSEGSLNSQTPIPSNPAAAYAATSSAKDALTVEISLKESLTPLAALRSRPAAPGSAKG
jgi:hypothetical protein